MQTILLRSAFLFLLLPGAFAQSPAYYTVKFPDDQVVYGCGATAPVVQPVITQTGNCNINVGISRHDQVYNTNATGTCYKIVRRWRLIYWCDYDPNWLPYGIDNPTSTDVGPTLNVTASLNHGFIEYYQIIKVVDTEAPVFTDCPTETLTFCDYTNNDPNQYYSACEGPVDLHVSVTDACSGNDIQLTYRLFLDLDANGSMETFVSSSAPNAWPIETSVSGQTLTGKIKFPNTYGLPYATHKIEWIANDKCGNESICKYAFVVKDCKPPTVVCMNGLSVNIMQTGMITLWASDFIQYTLDNCTPTNQLKIGIRKAGAGTGFPANTTSVTFDCSEIGTQPVEVWAQDAYGNGSYCTTYVIVQDNDGSCPPSSLKASILNHAKKPVSQVQVTLNKGAKKWNSVSDSTGVFKFDGLAASCNYTLTPILDTFAKAGVNTLDALLTAAHLQGKYLLSSPYSIIAADVDKSGAINADDVSEMVQLILSKQLKFNDNTAWNFVPASYVFPNPLDPLSATYPGKTTFCLPGSAAQNLDFVAIKTGDVDGSAKTVAYNGPDDRSGDVVAFSATNIVFKAGQEVRVDLMTPDLDGLAAFQFALDFNPNVLALQSVEPGLVSAARYASFPTEGKLSGLWYAPILLDPDVQGKSGRFRALTLLFTAQQNGTLREVLQLGSSLLDAQAYTRSQQSLNAVLLFEDSKLGKDGFTLYPSKPNPTKGLFTTGFQLAQGGTVHFTLSDAMGNIVEASEGNYAEGYHERSFDLGSSTSEGIHFLRVQSGEGASVQRILVKR